MKEYLVRRRSLDGFVKVGFKEAEWEDALT